MRLWTLHPKYLDSRGLTALWRESLLALKVLQGRTRGYRHHPQLDRFRQTKDPAGSLAAYLVAVVREARRRGYAFDAEKIPSRVSRARLSATEGQLLFEWRHLKRKLRERAPELLRQLQPLEAPVPHPLFRIGPGPRAPWERARTVRPRGGRRRGK